MSSLTYDALIAELFPRLTGGIRWGLERTTRLLASVDDPHRSFRSLHVGGTNGKGSVAASIDSVLRADGRRVGLYTSPHLCTFRERIRIDGRAISERDLLSAAERLWPSITAEQPSFFEATTAIAFLALADAGVDTGVIEVGLGGRLDSTNVIKPDVTVLTNVSLDHIQLLGPGIEDVAREKAGIIKSGVPVVTGEVASTAGAVFAAHAAAAGAPLRAVTGEDLHNVSIGLDGTAFDLAGTAWGSIRLRSPLRGRHQAVNAALAVHALGALRDPPSRDALEQGIAGVRWPGRFQVEKHAGTTWVFDVAHNVAGVEALVDTLRTLRLPRPLVILTGVLGDKDWRNMLVPLGDAADRLILTTPPTAPADRRWDPAEALRAAPSTHASIVTHFSDALHAAYEAAAGGTVVVTGSFHTVGDALASLGLCADGTDLPIERVTLG